MTTKNVKIVVTVPETHADIVREAIGNAGGGQVGNYSHCSFSSKGIGRFKPGEGANPSIGAIGKLEEVVEERIEITCSREKLEEIVKAIKSVHPYEEVSLDIYSLENIIQNLKEKDQVDAVFLTGSQVSGSKSYSDIDLVVIFKDNNKKINSLYTWIDNKFADIFFFDHSDLNRIELAEKLPANNMDAIFISWLEKSSISFDKSGRLTSFKEKIKDLNKRLIIPIGEKESFEHRINYNFVANNRYFESNDPLYHEALELRLLYSLSEIISGYFEFRNIPWRGEKTAIKYFKENDVNFYQTFLGYTQANNINDKFRLYTLLFKSVFTGDYKEWFVGDVLPQTKDQAQNNYNELRKYWEDLIA